MTEDEKKQFDQLMQLVTEERSKNDERLSAMQEGSEARAAELNEEIKRLSKAIEDQQQLVDDAVTAAKRASRMRNGGAAGDDDVPDEVREMRRNHREAFEQFIRSGGDEEMGRALLSAEREAIAKRAVSVGTPSAGGYALPEEIARDIDAEVIELSPMRAEATVRQVGTTDFKKLVNIKGRTWAWVGEGDPRSETGTSQFAEVKPTFGSIMAYPKASEESLDDLFFDVPSWLIDESTEAFAEGEGIAFIGGDGTKKPTGFLNGTPVATADGASPRRAFGTLQYVPTGAAGGFLPNAPNASPATHPSDFLIDMQTALKTRYKRNAKFFMNRQTQGEIRKWKDGEGNYLLRMGLAAGAPNTLLGDNVVEMPDMPAVAADAFPIAYGDMKAAYLIVDRVGLRITIDEVTDPGHVNWYIRKRVGGILQKDEALKVAKCAVS